VPDLLIIERKKNRSFGENFTFLCGVGSGRCVIPVTAVFQFSYSYNNPIIYYIVLYSLHVFVSRKLALVPI
jgi:hypothetical protein